MKRHPVLEKIAVLILAIVAIGITVTAALSVYLYALHSWLT